MSRAIVLNKDNDRFSAEVRDLSDSELAAGAPDTDVTIAVDYSTINYKDGLALTNRSPVVRKWPMVAGIDAAGTVHESVDARWPKATAVVLNGWGAGETHWGGLTQRARVRGDWLVALPRSLTTKQAMAIGTAGYTAMLCCLALEDLGVTPGLGELLVTGASGGVGSIAISILAGWGHRVVASTGKHQEESYLKSLGASAIIDRAELATAGKPLQKERWVGVVDSVGSHTLANACAQTRYSGVVTACGLAQGMDLPMTVAPLILRAVRLIGIDSVQCPTARRQQAWDRLARDLDRVKLDAITRVVPLSEAFAVARAILAGEIRGRVVVDVNR